ncbi:MAG: archease [Candidatus Jordarchaeum sp.]|uniref:archease n=1 Tax=Candidatus Jordarchaeum sp. TaxID=2823881 RepID=UPI00404B51A0
MGGYRFLEHTADIKVKAYGETVNEAFQEAARALSEAMTDTSKISPIIKRKIEIEAEDLEALLYIWLEEFIYLFDSKGMIFSDFKVENIKQTEEGLKLKGEALGEEFDIEKHPQRTGIKAVTYHEMKIKQSPKKTTLEFVLDI